MDIKSKTFWLHHDDMPWRIGKHSVLPDAHPVTQRLFAAGMAKLVFLDDYLRFEDLEREARNER